MVEMVGNKGFSSAGVLRSHKIIGCCESHGAPFEQLGEEIQLEIKSACKGSPKDVVSVFNKHGITGNMDMMKMIKEWSKRCPLVE